MKFNIYIWCIELSLHAVDTYSTTSCSSLALLSSLVTQFVYTYTSLTMEQKNLGYSLKNIPVASKKAYMKRMMEKMESLVRRMRWKALFFDKPELAGPVNDTYGFKTSKAPPQMEHLIPFEQDLHDMVCKVQFSARRDEFQKQLTTDAKEIAASPCVLVSADKTTILYEMSKDDYQKLLNDNVTKCYKKASDETKQGIDYEAKNIATELQLADRMEIYAEREPFITLKDHKENFVARPTCRLINPAKSEIGIIGKQMLEKINTRVREVTGSQQWRNTQSVIEWFKSITNRSIKKFIKFDIVEFYPSISEELLTKAISFAKTLTTITDAEEKIIWHARKSLLFSKGSTWVKRTGGLFDVTMGSYDGAEICELVGLYILSLLSRTFDRDSIGLYRDDGLAALKLSGPQADRARKDITQVFKDCGLRVTIETLLTQTDFLDVSFNIATGNYCPFRKPNSEPLYINAKSNHPPNILKHLPAAISSRISSNSCNQEAFSEAKPAYEEALQKSGLKSSMTYNETAANSKRKRKRKIVWFNPPYNKNVTTNVARRFLSLIDKHFPKHHRYHKLFNRITVKCSYSCMSNMASIISSHNAKILTCIPDPDPRTCNCRDATKCPLGGKCLAESMVYKATVTSPSRRTMAYYGLTEGAFKTRFNQHNHSFRTDTTKCRTETELSKHIWQLQDAELEYAISWEIKQKAAPYKCGTRRCDLCLAEKMVIATADPINTLNKRAEIVSTCRHRAKFRFASSKACRVPP